MSSIVSTAGDREPENRSRRENALDAFAVMCAVLFVLWPFSFGLGVIADIPAISAVGKGLMFLGFVWAVIGSPRWHGDSLESRGLGSPRRLFQLLREGPDRGQTAAIFATVFFGLIFFSLVDWPDAARFFRLPRNYRLPPDAVWKWVAIALGSASAAAIVATCAIRYDNFRSAFALALKISVAFLAYATLAAWLSRGEKAFSKFELADHTLDTAAHMFWGLLQQLTFTAFFATRLRKAFAPAATPSAPMSTWRRLGAVALGGVIAAVTLAPALWFAMRAVYGAKVPDALLGGLAAFVFPIGVVWTHFFCKDRRRMLVATLTGSCFGLIHIDSYGLVLVTTLLGTTFAYAAMEDRFRNLAAFAFMHGLLGATVTKLFGGKDIFRISLSVGPWAVKNPTAVVLIVPLVCLLAYAALAFWAARKLPAAAPETDR